MTARLIATQGALKNTTISLKDGEALTVGRGEDNKLVIPERYVSNRHCLIVPAADAYAIEDCGSSNGTFVNGERVTRAVLAHGSTIRVGRTEFVFLLGEDAPQSAVELISDSDESVAREGGMTLRPNDSVYLSAQTRPVDTSIEKKARNLEVLLQIGSKINSIRSSEALQSALLDAVFDAVPAERAAVLLTGHTPDKFVSIIGRHRDAGGELGVRVSNTICARVLKDGDSLLINDVLSDPGIARSESIQTAQIKSVLCVPLTVFETRLGVIYADAIDRHATFREGDLHLITAVANIASVALEHVRYTEWLQQENQLLLQEVREDDEMIGDHPAMKEVHRIIGKVAATSAKVLIRGESGVGKELVARALHLNSNRAGGPFIAINCAAIPKDLLESELFGHEKGAFSGADTRHKGKFEQADGGTIFLDEIGDMPTELQSKLLRAIERNEFYRLKGSECIRVDVRVVAATNRPLEEDIKNARFREDLFYRLRTVTIRIPPLRDRKEDIPKLAAHFLRWFSRESGRDIHGFTPDALRLLVRHDWPDNVRGLENAVQYAVIMSDGERIQISDLPDEVREALAAAPEEEGSGPQKFQDAVVEFKKRLVRNALDESKGNVTRAAKTLGLNSNYLHRLMNELGLRG